MATNFLNELQQNPRLRGGLWLIIGILLLYAFLRLQTYERQLVSEYNSTITHLARLQEVVSQAEWTNRAEKAQATRVELESRLWMADSKGLAQANFQAWLDLQSQTSKIEEQRLQIEDTVVVPDHEKLWKVTAQLRGNFEPDKLQRILYRIANHNQLIVTERLEIRQNLRQPIFTLVVTAYFAAPQTSAV